MTGLNPQQMRELADRADEAGGYEVMETGIVDELATALRTAADEVDRLRAVELTAEGALSEQQRLAGENRKLLAHVRKIRRDGAHRPSCDKNSGRRYARCTCWKEDRG